MSSVLGKERGSFAPVNVGEAEEGGFGSCFRFKLGLRGDSCSYFPERGDWKRKKVQLGKEVRAME